MNNKLNDLNLRNRYGKYNKHLRSHYNNMNVVIIEQPSFIEAMEEDSGEETKNDKIEDHQPLSLFLIWPCARFLFEYSNSDDLNSEHITNYID